jgi:hypothetical protein
MVMLLITVTVLFLLLVPEVKSAVAVVFVVDGVLKCESSSAADRGADLFGVIKSLAEGLLTTAVANVFETDAGAKFKLAGADAVAASVPSGIMW